MQNIRKHKLLLFSTILYYAGSYIAATIPGGQLVLVVAIGLMAFLVFANTGGKILVKNISFMIYILAFVLFCAASRLWAEDPSLSVNKINGLIFISIGMLIIHLSFFAYTSVDDLLKAIMYGSYLVVVYAFLRYGLGGIFRLAVNETRITNDLINGNILGICAAYAIVINVHFMFYEHIKFRDILVLPAVVLLIVTQSRKAIIILVLGIIGIYSLQNLNKRNFALSLLKLLGGLVLLGAIFFAISRFSFMQPTVNRLNEILEMLTGRGTRANNSAWIRFAYIDLGLQLFKEHPILGIGIGNANIYTQLYYGHNHYLHNNYIELLACSGIIGFILYYSMHAYLLINYFRMWKNRDKKYDVCLVLLVLNLIVDYGIVSYYEKANYMFLYLIWLNLCIMKKKVQYGSSSC